MGELVRAVECLNVPGDEMSDGIKQRRGVFSGRRVISLYSD